MLLITEKKQLFKITQKWRAQNMNVALIPTMGMLHQAHIAMIKHAKQNYHKTILTIFVNPTQFERNDDFDDYPRDIIQDKKIAEKLGVDLLFAPKIKEIYQTEFATCVNIKHRFSRILCAKFRKKHFHGVLTIVTKLFMICPASHAYFGEKDYQQLMLIKKLVADFDMHIKIIAFPTIRDKNGIAFSSRNLLLNDKQKNLAIKIYQTMLELAKNKANQEIISEAKQKLLSAGFKKIDYLEIRHHKTLAKQKQISNSSRIFIAAWLGSVRLIDNMSVEKLN